MFAVIGIPSTPLFRRTIGSIGLGQYEPPFSSFVLGLVCFQPKQEPLGSLETAPVHGFSWFNCVNGL